MMIANCGFVTQVKVKINSIFLPDLPVILFELVPSVVQDRKSVV